MRTTSATPLPRSWWAALSILSLGALGLTACDPKAEPDNDGRQEGDADADSDADTDADSDADADADLGAFEGTITWSSSEDDVESCAGTVAVSGAEYTGVCPDCDFAFSTDGVVASGDAPADCGLSPLLSLVEEGGAYRDLRIGHSNELTWYGETFSDVLIVGFTGYYGYDEPGYDDGGEPDTAAPPPAETVWIPVAGGGVPWESSFTRDGDQIAWSMSYGWSDYQANYRDYCGSYYGYEDYGADGRPEAVYGAFREGTTNYGGDFADLSDLDCGTYYTGYGYYDGGGGGGDRTARSSTCGRLTPWPARRSRSPSTPPTPPPPLTPPSGSTTARAARSARPGAASSAPGRWMIRAAPTVRR
jgi:hypothetical protein